jgi:hypothetical protein
MSKAEWLKLSPDGGSGNGTVTVSADEYTGRVPRETVITFVAANVDSFTRTVKQGGKPTHVDLEKNQISINDATVVSIRGISNSQKLSFAKGAGELNIGIPMTYSVNGMTVQQGVAIDGDPGAIAAYNFVIGITIPENDITADKTAQLIVTDEVGNQAICRITLAAGEVYVTVPEGDIELNYKGEPVTISVQSNTSWRVI